MVCGADAAEGDDVMTSLRSGDESLVASTDAEFMKRGCKRTEEADWCAGVAGLPNLAAVFPIVT